MASTNTSVQNRHVVIRDNNNSENVSVTQEITNVVEVNTGPRGIKGDTGPQGPPGSLLTSGDLIVTGSFIVSGAGHITSSGVISASGGFTGSIFGTASHAVTASFAQNAGSGIGFPFTGSAGISGSLGLVGDFTSSGVVSASRFLGGKIETASFATTASFAENAGEVLNAFSAVQAITTTGTASFADDATSASFATTASFAIVAGSGVGFPFTGSAGISGSLDITDNLVVTNITASIISASGGISGSFSGSFLGTASFADDATSASFATTSSFTTTSSFAITARKANSLSPSVTASFADDATSASFATTSSFALNVPTGTGFPFTGSAEISGSLSVNGPLGHITSSGNISASKIIGDTGSFNYIQTTGDISSSGNISASAFIGDGSGLTGTSGNPFPFTGSAEISGSLILTGSLAVRGDSTVTTEMNLGSEILHLFDTDTKFGFPSNDTFRIRTNATTGLTIDSDGQTEVLSLKVSKFAHSTTGGTSSLFIENKSNQTNLTNRAGIEFKHASNASVGGAIFSGKDNTYAGGNDPNTFSSNLQFFTALAGTDNERLRIDALGSVSASGTITASAFKGDGSGLTGLSAGFPFTGSAGISGSLSLNGPLNVTGVSGSISASVIQIGAGTQRTIKLVPGVPASATLPVITSNHSDIEFQKNVKMGFVDGLSATPTQIQFLTDGTFIRGKVNLFNDENLELFAEGNIILTASGTSSVIADTNVSVSGSLNVSESITADNFTGGTVVSSSLTGSFEGDGSSLFNLPQDTAFDGDLQDGVLQIITNQKFIFDNRALTSEDNIKTSSIEYNDTTLDSTNPPSQPVIFTKTSTDADESITQAGTLTSDFPIIFSGSNFAIHAIYQGFIDAGSIKVIDLNTMDEGAGGSGTVTNSALLRRIQDLIRQNANSAPLNNTTFNLNFQDSFEILDNTGVRTQQMGLTTFATDNPVSNKEFSYFYFNSESTRRRVVDEDPIPQIFKVTTNSSKVYRSLITDLDTTFNSNISASGIISSSGINIQGNISASRITGSVLRLGPTSSFQNALTVVYDDSSTALTESKNQDNHRDVLIQNLGGGTHTYSAINFKAADGEGKITLINRGSNRGEMAFLISSQSAHQFEALRISPKIGSKLRNISASVPITASGLHLMSAPGINDSGITLNYDSLPTSDPGIKGQVYRSSSSGIDNLLFISPGS